MKNYWLDRRKLKDAFNKLPPSLPYWMGVMENGTTYVLQWSWEKQRFVLKKS